MLESFSGISNSHKNRFLKMCLLLFPMFRSARFKNNGNIVFKQKGWFKPKIKVSFFNLITLAIPKELSMVRWGSYSLRDEIYEFMELLNSTNIDKEKLIIDLMEYLYAIFEQTKIRDVYRYYDNSFLPKEYKKDSMIDTFGSISLLKDKRKIAVSKVMTEFKLMAATLTLTLILNLPTKAYMLKEIAPLIREAKFPWIFT